MRNPAQVIPASVLHRHLWGTGPAGASDPLPVHLAGLRRKLESAGRPRVLHTVRGDGHVLQVHGDSGNAQATSSRRSASARTLDA